MKLVEFNFNSIPVPGLSIFVDGSEVAAGFIAEVLRSIPHLKSHIIQSTNFYFDMFVIRLTTQPTDEDLVGMHEIAEEVLHAW